jgi:hypothetical protein
LRIRSIMSRLLIAVLSIKILAGTQARLRTRPSRFALSTEAAKFLNL